VADSGIGSPTTLFGLPSTNYDTGEGSPSTLFGVAASSFDHGTGSPSAFALSFVVVAPVDGIYPDDGGEVVTLEGSFTDTNPYSVRLIDQGGALYPELVDCWSGVVAQGTECYPDTVANRLSFVLPPMPPGVYDIRVTYGPSAGLVHTLEDAIRIVPRNRSRATYRMRSNLAKWLARGRVAIQQEEGIQ